jgi:hypothetical protein
MHSFRSGFEDISRVQIYHVSCCITLKNVDKEKRKPEDGLYGVVNKDMGKKRKRNKTFYLF